MVGIRVDGNGEIGMGHISRCLSIASSLSKKQMECIFICSNDTSVNPILESGYNAIMLDSSTYSDWSIEEEEDCIRNNHVSTILIDSYYIKERHLRSIHGITKVVYLDDLQLYDYDVDAIVNYNIEADDILYENTQFQNRKTYLGVRYFPLKESLKVTSDKKISEGVRSVLITTGGTDPHKCVDKLLSAFDTLEYENIKFTVIIGLFFDEHYCEYLRKHYITQKNIVFLEWGQDMKKLYLDSDIVIAPGSTTVYEALSLGRPCISFQFAANQHEECIALDKMGLVPFMGDFSKSIEDKTINRLLRDELSFTRRKEQFDRFVNLFDGNGANRIADLIMGIDNENRV